MTEAYQTSGPSDHERALECLDNAKEFQKKIETITDAAQLEKAIDEGLTSLDDTYPYVNCLVIMSGIGLSPNIDDEHNIVAGKDYYGSLEGVEGHHCGFSVITVNVGEGNTEISALKVMHKVMIGQVYRQDSQTIQGYLPVYNYFDLDSVILVDPEMEELYNPDTEVQDFSSRVSALTNGLVSLSELVGSGMLNELMPEDRVNTVNKIIDAAAEESRLRGLRLSILPDVFYMIDERTMSATMPVRTDQIINGELLDIVSAPKLYELIAEIGRPAPDFKDLLHLVISPDYETRSELDIGDRILYVPFDPLALDVASY
jgi:hypothetical protein